MTYNELREIIDPIYTKLKTEQKFSDCHRCLGKGYISGYSHVKGGVCFRCGGKKQIPNAAARRRNEINRLMCSIVRILRQGGVEDITILDPYKQLMECVEKLPKKYKVKS